MTHTLLDPPTAPSTATVDRCQARILEFASRHPEIRHCIRQRVGTFLYVQPSNLDVHTLEGGRHEELVDIVVAARQDRIPVAVTTTGSGFVCVELDFGGMTLRAFDYSTTAEDDSVLWRLAKCPPADLPALVAQLAEAWEAGS